MQAIILYQSIKYDLYNDSFDCFYQLEAQYYDHKLLCCLPEKYSVDYDDQGYPQVIYCLESGKHCELAFRTRPIEKKPGANFFTPGLYDGDTHALINLEVIKTE